MSYQIILDILTINPRNSCFSIGAGPPLGFAHSRDRQKRVKHFLYCEWIEYSIKFYNLNYFNVYYVF